VGLLPDIEDGDKDGMLLGLIYSTSDEGETSGASLRALLGHEDGTAEGDADRASLGRLLGFEDLIKDGVLLGLIDGPAECEANRATLRVLLRFNDDILL